MLCRAAAFAAAALVVAVLAPRLATAALPEPVWTVEARDLELAGWRSRLAVAPDGSAWLGGGSRLGEPGGLLLRLAGGTWAPWRALPAAATRTYALATAPDGALWVAAYSPVSEEAYRALTVRRFDGRRWREERVEPGLWPQAMAMVSAEEGWIGGNHGVFLHRAGGRWVRETLDLAASDRIGANVLALHMRGPDDGWAVGARGLVARYRGGRWRALPVPEPMRDEQLYAVDVTADGRVWVVGSNGLAAVREAAGWRRLPVPDGVHLMGLDMLSPADGWAVGSAGTVLRWDGRAFRRHRVPTGADLHDVAMTSPDRGWIAGIGVLLAARPGPLPLFADAPRSPLAAQPARALSAVDADGDGRVDLLTLDRSGPRLWLGRGADGFVEAREGPAGPAGAALQGAAWGDADADGDLDLLLLGQSPAGVWLARQHGRGRFEPPERLAVEPLGGSGDSAHLVDLDADGDLDLYLARSASPGPRNLPNAVYVNDGTGRFAPRRGDAPGDRGIERLSLFGDLDGDRDLDLVLPGYGNELTLLLAERGRLRDATAGSGLDGPLPPGQASTGLLADLDRDGDLDLLLLGARLLAFTNDGRARFRRADGLFPPLAHNTAFAVTLAAAADLDHDGSPEVLLQAVHGDRPTLHLFSRGPDGRFRDLAERGGIAGLTGEAAAFVDADGDGDLDLALASERGTALLENRRDDRGSLVVRPRGAAGGPAVGARVTVREAGDRPAVHAVRQLAVGHAPASAQGLSEVHVGVEPGRRYDVEVAFPRGRTVVVAGVAAGRTLVVHERPAGIRHLLAAAATGRRALRAAEPRWELPKLAAAALALALWSGTGAGRRRRWPAVALLAAGYLGAAGAAALDGRPAAHAAHLTGFGGVVALAAAVDHARRAGERRLGPWRLLSMIGEGGMGVVHRARHDATGRTVALKVLHPRLTEREEHRRRLLREARILTELDHPGIVRMVETGEVDGRAFIAMELLTGMSLHRLVAERGPLPPAAAAALLGTVAAALAHVHARGLVHRDVKSDNIFVVDPAAALAEGPAGIARRVKLMDFGLARGPAMETLTRRGLAGTLAYVAPELLRGAAPGPASDLWALGVVAWEALAGRLPFAADDEGSLLARIQAGEAPPLGAVRPEVPAPLAELVDRLLARDPLQRPAAAVAAACASGWPLAALPASGPAPAADGWHRSLAEAERQAARGRTTEAQVLALSALAELRAALAALDPDARGRWATDRGVEAALATARRLCR